MDLSEDTSLGSWVVNENVHQTAGKRRDILLVANQAHADNVNIHLSPNESNGANPEREASSDDAELGVQRPVNYHCKAVPACVTQCHSYRKIVSHIYGRNKACTQALPENAWVLWCRKHYQRLCFRAKKEGNWHLRQLQLVRQQLDKFEEMSVVESWTIMLGKKTSEQLRRGFQCWEEFLLPYLGEKKSSEEVRAALGLIEMEFCRPAFIDRRSKEKHFPAVEFLPTPPKGLLKATPNKLKKRILDAPHRTRVNARRSAKRRRHCVRVDC